MQPSAGLFQKLIPIWQTADEQGVRPESHISSAIDRMASSSPQTLTVPFRETGVNHCKVPQNRADSSRSHCPRAICLHRGVMPSRRGRMNLRRRTEWKMGKCVRLWNRLVTRFLPMILIVYGPELQTRYPKAGSGRKY